jgi:predicted SnoaL-like aldol condensation-catalyzing enzyme
MNSSQVIARPAGMDRRPGAHAPLDVRKALYLRWIKELWAGRRVARELVSDDFVGHWPTTEVHGPEQLERHIETARTALRDLSFVVDLGPFADGELVCARWIATGSDRRGPARYVGNDILRVEGGKIVEYWSSTSRA